MKDIGANITKCIQKGTTLNCIDNSGAKKLKMISVKSFKGRRRRLPKAGVGDIIMCSVIKGKEKIRHEVVHAVVVRQNKEYTRANGRRVQFEDNAAVVVNPTTHDPEGTEIKSAVAKEAVLRFTTIGKISTIVV